MTTLVVALVPALAVATPATAGAPGNDDGARAATPVAIDAPIPGDVAGKLGQGVSGLSGASGRQSVYVQLRGESAADAAGGITSGSDSLRRTGAGDAQTAALGRRTEIRAQGRSVLATAQDVDGRATRLFTTTNALPGVGLTADADAIRALAERPDVARISRLVPKSVASVAAPASALARAVTSWRSSGGSGRGVSIGVLDTGLDFTHADFGGAGTSAAYAAAAADSTSSTWRDGLSARGRLKVGGGYDFVGDDYNATENDPAFQPVPHPDPDPLDCNGHGTHVAGTAAGYGVTTAGRTFAGDYGGSATVEALRMAPGTAPEATLYPLRIFGCAGDTTLITPALDWALDPNGDGDFSDHLDVVNLSVGAPFTVADDPEARMVDALSRQGVLTVASAGNGGDLTDAAGTPGNAASALTVAGSDDGVTPYDGLRVDGPSQLGGAYSGQFSIDYDWSNSDPVTADVVTLPADNSDGCTAYSPDEQARVAGRIVWLTWDDTTRRCGSTPRADLAEAAGAAGVLLTSGVEMFTGGVAGNAGIPMLQLTGPSTEALRAAAEAGDLRVGLDGAMAGQAPLDQPDVVDTLMPSSSRGTHGSPGVVKPDVAAPAVSIASAAVGTGSGLSLRTGTSMASPAVAGIAAAIMAQHPAWGPLSVKAAIVDTAGQDLFTGGDHTGARYGPARVGSGGVDAAAAFRTPVLAFVRSRDMAVSASFGVLPAPVDRQEVRRTRTLVVDNRGPRPVSVDLSYDAVDPSPGVDLSVSPATLLIPARSSATATVTVTVRPTELRHTIDASMEATTGAGAARQFVSDASGLVLVTPAGQAPLRVPVYVAAKPASSTRAVPADGGLLLEGTGVDQGEGPSAYQSLVSVLELGATSPRLPRCSTSVVSDCTDNAADRAADLRAVGAASAYGYVWFGIATWGQATTQGRVQAPVVDIDVDGDGESEYQVVPWNVPGTDVPVAAVVPTGTGIPLDSPLPTNFLTGDTDTNAFDSDVVLLPVAQSLLGDGPITYRVSTESAYMGGDTTVDTTGDISFDPTAAAVRPAEPVYVDAGGTTLPVAHDAGARALVIHLHGCPGRRAEIVRLP